MTGPISVLQELLKKALDWRVTQEKRVQGGRRGEGRFVTSGVELIRRAIFSSFRTTKFFYDIAFRSSVVLFLACQKSLFAKNAFVCLS